MDTQATNGFYPRPEETTGTTLVAVEFDGGVVVGTDSRTSAGSFIASRVTDKITPITNHLVVLRAGTAADTQAVADLARYQIEVYSIMENAPLSIYRSSQVFRKFLYNYREQLGASCIVAGYDEKEGGQVYTIPSGGMLVRQHFTSSGSGGHYIMTYFDNNWRPGMSVEEVKQLVKRGVALAVHRDDASGGVVRLAVIDKNGYQPEIHRYDRNDLPEFAKPKVYTTYPPHILQHPTE
ncbi:Proteasome subunit beta [Aphelenchoides besseyi]|nr:Proteasome subunit beta [Aphelenchoides besseyi]KAI6199332.1 Proteasome subunit beta [Aphelenchoides besseyi]